MTRELSIFAWPEVAERAGRTILAVPLGSTEQHGPHLPLSTDTDIAVELSKRLAAAVPEVLMTPPIHFTASGEHSGFPGTLSIGQVALELLLVELCRSADAFAGVVLVSTHGGNRDTAIRAVRRLRSEGRSVACWFPVNGEPADSHAGWTETSCLLSIRPEAVRRDRIHAGNTSPLADLLPSLRRSGVASVSPSGVLGDPRGSSASAGDELLRRWAAELVLTVR
ncbi:MAG TPA: mycofactocin biosynthesis peptidyl-dipeptidase MftE, partial [Acidimicrobiales bacterium]|nr:mycofactocin biosynthesis peptidyl-dipeptidase MftE [Acidimicrobiales bacterium]